MRISTILNKIDENQLFVPAFQREYVWKRDDAKQLLDSLIKQYPTGTMLTWETNHPPALKGVYQYDQRQGAVRILLDGQQRITTLYLLIRGTIPPYYSKSEVLNDTRGLYMNTETGELEYYLRTKMDPDPRWQNVTAIFQRRVRTKDIVQDLEGKGQIVDRALENRIDDNLNAFQNILDRDFPEQTIPIKATIREAIDIFYKVNASGVALRMLSWLWRKSQALARSKRRIQSKTLRPTRRRFRFQARFCDLRPTWLSLPPRLRHAKTARSSKRTESAGRLEALGR